MSCLRGVMTVAALAALVGPVLQNCGSNKPTPPPSPKLERLEVVPADSMSMIVGQSQVFAATLWDTSGAEVSDIGVSWLIHGNDIGTLNSDTGRIVSFIATNAGDGYVVAKAKQTADSTHVTVLPARVSIVIAPDS